MRRAALIAAAVMGAACSTGAPPSARPAAGVGLEELAIAPRRHLDETVTVSGVLGRIFSTRRFTIVGGGEGGRHELLVVVPDSERPLLTSLADSALVRDAVVQVTGILRAPGEDSAAGSAANTGGRQRGRARRGTDSARVDNRPALSQSFTPEFRNSLILQASQIVVTPRPSSPVVELTARSGYPVSDAMQLITARAPDTLTGRSVALLTAQVQSVESDRAFWIGADDAQRMLVVMAAGARVDNAAGGARTLAPGDTVSIAGVVRALPSDVRFVSTDWGLTPAGTGALAGEQVYLDASRVRRVASTGAR
ncbi:MAG TPA: hypothetical protein VFK13_06615 [Gemmatimonadaceae bacterium]|nr:hypothetical protein [Gemmatimonadaceae bacterium]